MLEVCLLGTGGMMPLPGRWLTSLLIRYKGRMLLIDCGEGTQIPLKMCGWGFKAIDAVLFTHYHADHIMGLPGFLLTLGNSGREEPLILAGPPGIKPVVEGLTVVCPRLPFEIHLLEIPVDQASEMVFGELIIRSLPVEHWMPCLAYSVNLKRKGKFNADKARELDIPLKYWSLLQNGETIQHEGRILTPEMVLGEPRKGIKLSYCTDSRPVNDMADFVRDSDLFVCEGMYGDDQELSKAIDKKHMLFSEAAHLAKQGEVKELWLTHFSPALENPQDYINTARAIFDNTTACTDLMSKSLKFDEA